MICSETAVVLRKLDVGSLSEELGQPFGKIFQDQATLYEEPGISWTAWLGRKLSCADRLFCFLRCFVAGVLRRSNLQGYSLS